MEATDERWRGRLAATGCAVLLAALVCAAHPVAEMGILDEWSYAYSAKVVAATGHVVYNGWATAMLTWMLYWAALFVRCFGFSYLALRASVLLVSMATVFLVHRLLRRAGLSETHSTVGTLAVMLAPPFFSLSFLYMSDLPGTLALVVCFYGVVRALDSKTANAVTVWLVFAAVSNLFLGSVRQIALLGLLVLVPSAALRLRRTVRLPVLVPVWLVCVACVGLLLHWFGTQPYSVAEPLLLPISLLKRMGLLVRVPAAHLLYLAPVFAVFLTELRWKERRVRLAAYFLGAITILCGVEIVRGHAGALMMPYMPDTITSLGFHDVGSPLGEAPVVLGRALRVVLSCVTFVLLAGTALSVLKPRSAAATRAPVEAVRTLDLLWIFVPFVSVYLLLFVTRFQALDRYLIPLTPLVAILVLRFVQSRSARRGIPVGVAVAALGLAMLDVALLHDEFALYHARAELADRLVALGVPRSHILGGFEYDGWTEIEATGYVKDPKLKLRAGQQGFDRTLTWSPLPTRFFLRGYTPSLQPDYVITRSILPGMEPSDVPAVVYRTWTTPGSWSLQAARITSGTLK